MDGTVDGVYALTHPFGCSQLGQDQENIKHLLSAIALNPNATFVLFVGLGCENNGLGGIKECLENCPKSSSRPCTRHISHIQACAFLHYIGKMPQSPIQLLDHCSIRTLLRSKDICCSFRTI